MKRHNGDAMTLDGALEEILARHRKLIDNAVRAVADSTPIDEFIETIEAHVLALREQEPSFWELRVVEYIYSVAKGELKASLSGEADPAESEMDARRQIQQSLQGELGQMLGEIHSHDHRGVAPTRQHFMETFWAKLTEKLSATGDRKPCEGHGDADELPPEHLSYEALTFDDLNLEGNSATSAPSIDEIPLMLSAFQDEDAQERHMALSRLLEIPAIELVHCRSHLIEIVTGACRLITDADFRIARNSIRLIYQIINQVEDASLFMDTYLILVNTIATSTGAGTLIITPPELSSHSASEHTIRSVDVCRLLLVFMDRLPHHWIHATPEVLTRAVCATFVLLLLDIGASEKKACRPIDIFAHLDSNAQWFTKWMLKAPSRTQLLLSLDETGFVSDLMHCMARVRPFDSSMESMERTKATNALSILSVLATTHGGRNMMFSWTKLPAHAHQQRRYMKWIGLSRQFQLETRPSENDRLVHFLRCDREMRFDSTDLELEDVEPLGDRVIEAIAMSTLVMYLVNINDDRCHERELEDILTTIAPALQYMTSHQTLAAELFELLKRCTRLSLETTFGSVDSCETGVLNDVDAQDPWFPFRRATDPTTIARMTFEHFRSLHKLKPLCVSLQRRCAVLLERLLACTASFSVLDVSTAVALTESIDCYRISVSQVRNEMSSPSSIPACALVSLHRIIQLSPYTMGALLAAHNQELLLHVVQAFDSADPTAAIETNHAAQQVLLALADCSSATMVLQRLGVAPRLIDRVCAERLKPEVLHLLVLPDAADALFASTIVQSAITDLNSACAEHLDIAVSLNSIPPEANFRLRKLMRGLGLLRAVLGTQFACRLLDNTALDWCRELVRIIQSHDSNNCYATPQSEDVCTIAFEMLSSMSGCIPSMASLYDMVERINARGLLASDTSTGASESVSACKYLASTLASSLSHIGGRLSDWRRASRLCDFHASLLEDQLSATEDHRPYQFSSTMVATVEQMRESIEHSRVQDVPLDMVMLSQAAWELIGDVEGVVGDVKKANLLLTRTFGMLTFELIRSGRSKLGFLEGGCERRYPLSLATRLRDIHDHFPSDAERKLMNRYYKDYAQRLGLKATPTILHVMTKAFGKAAVDCFAITMLMILDQTQVEKDLLECLNYCSSCPGIGFVWSGVDPSTSTSRLEALSTLAQAAEMILEIDHPRVFSTLRHCHCSVLTLALRWHGQCYWNFLPWNNILLMIYLTALYGAEFQVYFFVAVVKYMEPTFRETIARNAGDSTRAYTEVLQSPITGFRFSTHRNLFLRLRSSYHDRIQAMIKPASLPRPEPR